MILAINGGSSSLKFALFDRGEPPLRRAGGTIERIGLPDSVMLTDDNGNGRLKTRPVHVPDQNSCVGLILDWVEGQATDIRLEAIGHRIVHGGMDHYRPELVTPELLADLREMIPYDPEHLPSELALIDACMARCPSARQIACFDTAFHHDMPAVARWLPIPRRYYERGVRRYGFHGLSYASLLEELKRTGAPGESDGRIIFAHLGSGASMAAVKRGRPVDTTMGFTPASGMPMSRRAGDLDPNLVAFLSRTEGMSLSEFQHLVNRESGLLGMSEVSADMRELLAREAGDPRAADAIELFCYQARKWIGALAAAMDGLDTLVFSGGIGERAPTIRARICRGLTCLGLTIDRERNETGHGLISAAENPVVVRVMQTDEEGQIALAAQRLLHPACHSS